MFNISYSVMVGWITIGSSSKNLISDPDWVDWSSYPMIFCAANISGVCPLMSGESTSYNNTGTRRVFSCIIQTVHRYLKCHCVCLCHTCPLAIRYAAMGICWKRTARWRPRYPSPSANDGSAPYRISWMTIDKWPCLFRGDQEQHQQI